MRLWLFDTSFVVDLFKHENSALQLAAKTRGSPAIRAISTVTVHEVLRGVYYLYEGKTLGEKLRLAEEGLNQFDIIPYTYEIAKRAAMIDADLVKAGHMLPFADVAIGATALFYGLTLVAKNAVHFNRVKHLRVEGY
nr:type II toxin-antitoxin system VapC family toxin [Candidatus Njordarchaeota archaeon]